MDLFLELYLTENPNTVHLIDYNNLIQMDLRCAICNKDYDQFERLPKVIPQCGHTYCQKCIKKKVQQRKNIFICPIDNQSHIFRRQNDQLPRNFAIINAMKQKKSQSISKNRQNIIIKKYQDDIKNSSLVCEQHQKPKEFICLDDQNTICSHCALFGSHRGHKIQKITKPKIGKGLESLFDKAMTGMDSLSQQAIHVTQSPNIFVQSFQNLKRTLRTSIKQVFKSYHQIINRRQIYVEKELDEIIRNWQNQTENLSQKVSNSYKNIINIKEHLNVLSPDKQQSNRDPQILVMQLEDLIEKMKLTEKDISKTKQEIGIKCRQYQIQYKQRLEASKFFKIQQVAVDMSGNTYTNPAESRSRSIQDNNSSYNIKVRPPSHSINQSRDDYMRKDSNMLPPKHHTTTNLIKLGSTAKSRLITSHEVGDSLSKSNQRQDNSIDCFQSRKCSPSPIQKQKQQKRTSGRGQVRKKISNILQIISKCQTSTLQLLGLEIKDYYLQEIFDFIIKSNKKFGVIKFVKNDITDQGLAIILQAIKNYQYLHTLNFTSNQLTENSLDLIIKFTQKNKILKNFYLRNNLINYQKTKEKKKQMFEKGLNMFL